MSHRILLVDPDPTALARARHTLATGGYRVASLSSFHAGATHVSRGAPDLLVTALRLEEFNGLHLLLHGRAHDPELPVIVTGADEDLTPDVRRFGAHFMSRTSDPTAFVALVTELLRGREPKQPNDCRTWPRKGAELAATLPRGSAYVAELSYGGVRLKVPGEPPHVRSEPFELRLPDLGVAVNVVAKWRHPAEGEDGWWWCGAEVSLPTGAAVAEWRNIVDSVN